MPRFTYATPTFINKALCIVTIYRTSLRKKVMTLTAPFSIIRSIWPCLLTIRRVCLLFCSYLTTNYGSRTQQLSFKNFWTSFRIIEGMDKQESDKWGSTVLKIICTFYFRLKLIMLHVCTNWKCTMSVCTHAPGQLPQNCCSPKCLQRTCPCCRPSTHLWRPPPSHSVSATGQHWHPTLHHPPVQIYGNSCCLYVHMYSTLKY